MSVMQSAWMFVVGLMGFAIAFGVPVWLRARGLAMDLDRRYAGSPWFGSRRTAELELLIDLPPSFRLVATPEALVVDDEVSASTIPWSDVTGIDLDVSGKPPVLLLSLDGQRLPLRIERGRLAPAEILEKFTARWLAA